MLEELNTEENDTKMCYVAWYVLLEKSKSTNKLKSKRQILGNREINLLQMGIGKWYGRSRGCKKN